MPVRAAASGSRSDGRGACDAVARCASLRADALGGCRPFRLRARGRGGRAGRSACGGTRRRSGARGRVGGGRLRDRAPGGPAVGRAGANCRRQGRAARAPAHRRRGDPASGGHPRRRGAGGAHRGRHGYPRALRRRRPRRCGHLVRHCRPAGAERRRLDRPSGPAAGRLDRGCRPRVAVQGNSLVQGNSPVRPRRGPHRDRAPADGGVPGQRSGRHRAPWRLVIDPGPGRRGRIEQPQRPVHRERDRLRPLARDRRADRGPRERGDQGHRLAGERLGDGKTVCPSAAGSC